MASEESGLLLSLTTPSSPRGPYHGIEASADDEDGIFSRHISSSDGRYSYCTKPLLIILATSSIVIGISTFILVGFAPQETFHSGVLSTTTNLSLLGKSNKKKKDEKNKCDRDTSYSKHTLKSAYDLPYAALFRKYIIAYMFASPLSVTEPLSLSKFLQSGNTHGQSKFEASDVTIVNDTVYSVCDSSWAISKFTMDLTPFSDLNVQIGDPNREEDDESGYEAIFEHGGLFYVVRESVFHADHDNDDEKTKKKMKNVGDYHAIVEELDLDLGNNDYTVVRECQCDFTFEGDSKGFEGAVGYPDKDGVLYILGLCEGNHCSESKKNDVGNGRVVLMKKKEEGEVCAWETVRVISIPKSAAFLDYSALDITASGRVAIASQEHSAVWLGRAAGISNGVIDPEAFEFEDDSSSSAVLQFPKDGGCHTI